MNDTTFNATESDSRADLQHEAGDRTFVASQHFTDFVRDHPFIQSNPDLTAQAARIEEQMAELYQSIWRAA